MADMLDPGMLPGWLQNMDQGPSVRPGPYGAEQTGIEWCGSFTVHGLGFQTKTGTVMDFAMAWPIGGGDWQVLEDAYDIEDPMSGPDLYIETPLLHDIVRENGRPSLTAFMDAEGEGWSGALTRAVAAHRCRERFAVPNLYRSGDAAFRELVSYAARLDPAESIDSLSRAIRDEMSDQGTAYELDAFGGTRGRTVGQKRIGVLVPGRSVHQNGLGPFDRPVTGDSRTVSRGSATTFRI